MGLVDCVAKNVVAWIGSIAQVVSRLADKVVLHLFLFMELWHSFVLSVLSVLRRSFFFVVVVEVETLETLVIETVVIKT